MNRKASVVGMLGIFGLVLGLAPVEPVGAVGSDNVQFRVSGRLEQFPCEEEEDCPPVNFDGTGHGGGQITTMVDGVPHTAQFTILAGDVTGEASYTEPGPPTCPAFGFASGSVTLSGGATGIIHRVQTGPTLPGGTVSEASFTLDFSYRRVGFVSLIEITGGEVIIEYFIPDTGSGTITESIVTGEATGVFNVDPIVADQLCENPGPLDFELIGDAAVVTE